MEIGGFITEGAEIVNHDNSLSGNGTVDSPLGFVHGYNETVLWTGTTASNNNNNFGGSWNINESLSSFESVDIYHWESYACPDITRKNFNISRVPIMDNSFFLQIGPYPENTGTANWFNMKVYGDDKQVRISGGFNAFPNQNILLFNSTNMWSHGQVYKIVGINRIANN